MEGEREGSARREGGREGGQCEEGGKEEGGWAVRGVSVRIQNQNAQHNRLTQKKKCYITVSTDILDITYLLSNRASFLLRTSRVRGFRGRASETLVLLVFPMAAPVTASSLMESKG